jgi:hypothetical protein
MTHYTSDVDNRRRIWQLLGHFEGRDEMTGNNTYLRDLLQAHDGKQGRT